MNRNSAFQVIFFFLYLLAQVLLFKRLVLFNTSFCFLYVAFILMLPNETNILVLMGVAFLMGFSVDIFYDSLGLHAFSLVMVAYLRNYWLNTITPQGGYDSNTSPGLAMNGLQWFLVYTLPLIFVHHAVLFFVEAGGFGLFWYTMLKIIGSTVFTMAIMLMLQYLGSPRRL
jgi:hypothetical protein